MVDNRIIKTKPLSKKALEEAGLLWLVEGENEDYLSSDFISFEEDEIFQFKKVAKDLHGLAIEAARKVANESLWEQVGIPLHAAGLIRYSLDNELAQFLVGRFDFAGGIDDNPIKLIEYNADTCSLLAETSTIQEDHWKQEKANVAGEPLNDLMPSLIEKLEYILEINPDKTATLLISTMGYEEDWITADIIAKAAENAGFEDVQFMPLEKVIFSEEEGIYVEDDHGVYTRFDFWYKIIPWDFFLTEEPELFRILDRIVRDDLATILNPACSMLLQSKALLKIMYELAPNYGPLLKASFSQDDFPNNKYVEKPFNGRMGENIALYDGKTDPIYKTDGDYGEQKTLFQELARFDTDLEGYRYQPSIFWTGEASALCVRRQDDLIIDDDAEFISHTVR